MWVGKPQGPHEDDDRILTLQELAEATGVSVRTVRYYIAEGLLPPPVGAGPRSGYTVGHLDRLRLIGRLKDAYLPLKEIRRRVAGLSDSEIRQRLTSTEKEDAPDNAAAYLDTVLGPSPPAPPAVRRFRLEAREPPSGIVETATEAHRQLREELLPSAHELSVPSVPLVTDEPVASGTTWRRLEIGDDVELLVRDEAYERRRERIEWLVNWARKVFQ